ncbi:MAG: hypothetical protein CME19_05590 [Gemmatimonadetes bacterium]|nr:hypothetical protein [Gemmatimonadota bacterium]|tara:strand:- start:1763 stop:1984 length:222 start_codon:yes stop_codon:yes gene_type:complete
MVLSGEATAARRLQAELPKLFCSGMAIDVSFLIGQMSLWFVLPSVVLSYAGVIGMSVVGRARMLGQAPRLFYM